MVWSDTTGRRRGRRRVRVLCWGRGGGTDWIGRGGSLHDRAEGGVRKWRLVRGAVQGAERMWGVFGVCGCERDDELSRHDVGRRESKEVQSGLRELGRSRAVWRVDRERTNGDVSRVRRVVAVVVIVLVGWGRRASDRRKFPSAHNHQPRG